MSLQSIYVNVPEREMNFFKELLDRMGWTYEAKGDLVDRYIATRPTKCDISDEEIMDEVSSVRYKK